MGGPCGGGRVAPSPASSPIVTREQTCGAWPRVMHQPEGARISTFMITQTIRRRGVRLRRSRPAICSVTAISLQVTVQSLITSALFSFR